MENLLIQYLFLFIFGAVGGWFLEVAFRSLRHKSLVNPGFLNGPYVPLYGFGVVLLHLFCQLDYSFIASGTLQIIFFAVIVTVSLTLIELVTGLIFIHGLKIKLWDYSNLKPNFMGIISPVFSLAWGILGVGYYFLINPWLAAASVWMSGDLLITLLVGLIYGIFFFDLFSVLKVGTQIRNIAAQLKTTINYEELKKKFREKIDGRKKATFFNHFKHIELPGRFKEAIQESRFYKKISSKKAKHQAEGKQPESGT